MVRYQRTTRSSVGSHSLPLERNKPVQGVEDLGWPLSHGCTRLDDSNALAVYRWAAIGTVVVVF
jgi:L,D-transpeptidase catalytic domain